MKFRYDKNSEEMPAMLFPFASDENKEFELNSFIKFLIQNGFDINSRDRKGNSLLHKLARLQGPAVREVIQALIIHGADVNIQNNDRNSPLYFAIVKRADDTAEFLINNGAQVQVANNDGNTPLHLAAYIDQDTIVRLLLGRGVNINIQNNQGQTPLHIAILYKSARVEAILVAAGADTTIENNDHQTAEQFGAKLVMGKMLKNRRTKFN